MSPPREIPAKGPGLRFPDVSPLRDRAVEMLERGPRTSGELARRVLGVRSAPAALAERVVGELLAGEPRVERAPADGKSGGRWRRSRGEPRGASAAPASLDYVVVDVETTGASPRKGDRVTEIAAVEVSGGRVVGEFSSLVNPGRPIPPPVSRLTGITDGMVRDAPPFDEIADRVRTRLEGRIFVAHNVPFDWRFVSHELRCSRAVVPVGPRLCTLRLARRALPGLPRKGLDAVCRYYGIEIEDRHRALGDSLATAALLMRLVEEADRLGVESWSDLRAWLDGGSPPGQSGI